MSKSEQCRSDPCTCHPTTVVASQINGFLVRLNQRLFCITVRQQHSQSEVPLCDSPLSSATGKLPTTCTMRAADMGPLADGLAMDRPSLGADLFLFLCAVLVALPLLLRVSPSLSIELRLLTFEQGPTQHGTGTTAMVTKSILLQSCRLNGRLLRVVVLYG